MLDVLFTIRLGNRGAGKSVMPHRGYGGVCVSSLLPPGPLRLPLEVCAFSLEAMRAHIAIDSFDFTPFLLQPAHLVSPVF